MASFPSQWFRTIWAASERGHGVSRIEARESASNKDQPEETSPATEADGGKRKDGEFFTEVFIAIPVQLTGKDFDLDQEFVLTSKGSPDSNDYDRGVPKRRSLRGLAAIMNNAETHELMEAPTDAAGVVGQTPTHIEWLTHGKLLVPNWKPHDPLGKESPKVGVIVLSGTVPLKYENSNSLLPKRITDLRELVSYVEYSKAGRASREDRWRLRSVEPSVSAPTFLYWAIHEAALKQLADKKPEPVETTENRMIYMTDKTTAHGTYGVLDTERERVGASFVVGSRAVLREVKNRSRNNPLLEKTNRDAIAIALLLHYEVDAFAREIELLADRIGQGGSGGRRVESRKNPARFQSIQAQFFSFRASSIWPRTTHNSDQQALIDAIDKSLRTESLINSVHKELNEYAELERTRAQSNLNQSAHRLAAFGIAIALAAIIGQILPPILEGFQRTPTQQAWILIVVSVLTALGCGFWWWKRRQPD